MMAEEEEGTGSGSRKSPEQGKRQCLQRANSEKNDEIKRRKEKACGIYRLKKKREKGSEEM